MVQKTRTDIMGMPLTVKLVDQHATEEDSTAVFDYFTGVDAQFSTYKDTSEISQINQGKIAKDKVSKEMQEIFEHSIRTQHETDGYFNIEYNGQLDPSGIVKGWAIENARKIIEERGIKNFFIDAGGDITMSGMNELGTMWRVGIRNPFNRYENIKILQLTDKGVATSGTYIRGSHIYNPKEKSSTIEEIVSVTVIGPTIFDADRFATAAFAMGKKGIYFIENLQNFEGYMIDKKGIATETSGFFKYVV